MNFKQSVGAISENKQARIFHLEQHGSAVSTLVHLLSTARQAHQLGKDLSPENASDCAVHVDQDNSLCSDYLLESRGYLVKTGQAVLSPC